MTAVVLGKPVSGRTWKEPASRTSSRISVKTLHTGYAKRMEKLALEKQQRAILKEMKDEVAAEKQVSFHTPDQYHGYLETYRRSQRTREASS